MTIELIEGDCREVLREFADNSIDSVVTDPPYALTMTKRLSRSNPVDVEKNFTKTIPGQGVNPYRSQARGQTPASSYNLSAAGPPMSSTTAATKCSTPSRTHRGRWRQPAAAGKHRTSTAK